MELECDFSPFGGVLSGDVHFCRNFEKVAEAVYAKRNAMFFHKFALRLFCPRLASIFDIPEVELECDFSLFGCDLSGDVQLCRNLDKVGETVYAKRDAIFPTGLHWAYVAHVWRPFSTYRKWN